MWIRVYIQSEICGCSGKAPKSGPAACSLLGMNEAALTDSTMCSGALLTHLTPLFSKSDLLEVSAESNKTLSSLKKSRAAVSQRIISGTSKRAKSLRWLAGNGEPPHHLFQVLEQFQHISQTLRQFLWNPCRYGCLVFFGCPFLLRAGQTAMKQPGSWQ